MDYGVEIITLLGTAAGAGAMLSAGLARISRRNRVGGPDFIDNMADGYYRMTPGGDLAACNHALARLLGYPSRAATMADAEGFSQRLYADEWTRADINNALYRHGSIDRFVTQVNRQGSRTPIWVNESCRVVRDMFGRTLFYEGTLQDVTDTVERLELERRQTMLARNAPAIMMQAELVNGHDLRIVYASDAMEHTFGELGRSVRLGHVSLQKLVHAEDLERMVQDGRLSIRNRTQMRETYRMRGANGDWRWIEVHASSEKDNGTVVWHGFLIDVTERKRVEDRANNLAFFDQLTELPNRRSVLDTLQLVVGECERSAARAAYALVDLDGFKELNSVHGHSLGDHVLKAVAKRFTAALGDDGKLGRIGADEFAVVMTKLDEEAETASETAMAIVQRLVDALSEPVEVMGVSCDFSCSIGVAMIDRDGPAPYEVVRFADAALNTAKAAGRGRAVLFRESMAHRPDRQLVLSTDLRRALRQNEFVLHYQPQADAKGAVVGAEALLRWQHPTEGIVGPDRFIPAAERSGLIVDMTDAVLDQAFETLGRWSRSKSLRGLDLSINISAQQFSDPTFLERMQERAEAAPDLAERAVLELTESVLFEDIDRLTHVMDALREMGFRFSLDDFGTGYSSFGHLRRLPFDEIKIDGSFVRELAQSPNDRAIVRAIIAMARTLDMHCVAEWVEDEDQRRFLEVEGCQRLQGYLFGAAMPREEFEKRMEAGEKPVTRRTRKATVRAAPAGGIAGLQAAAAAVMQ